MHLSWGSKVAFCPSIFGIGASVVGLKEGEEANRYVKKGMSGCVISILTTFGRAAVPSSFFDVHCICNYIEEAILIFTTRKESALQMHFVESANMRGN